MPGMPIVGRDFRYVQKPPPTVYQPPPVTQLQPVPGTEEKFPWEYLAVGGVIIAGLYFISRRK